MGYLDSSGLSHFWSKIKTILNGKQDSLAIGDGLSLNENIIGVTDPVKGITKAEYDALTEEEKSAGLYILTDVEDQADISGATFTPSVSDEGVISWTNDKGLPNPAPVNIKGPQGLQGETGPKGEGALPAYSVEETRIGTWIDGKPIYRITFSCSISSLQKVIKVLEIENFDVLVDISGICFRNDSYFKYTSGGLHYEIGAVGGAICIYIATEIYLNKPITITAMYTKTTDAATIPQATILTSEVNPFDAPISVSYASASASADQFNL